jgi:hypothetical protein
MAGCLPDRTHVFPNHWQQISAIPISSATFISVRKIKCRPIGEKNNEKIGWQYFAQGINGGIGSSWRACLAGSAVDLFCTNGTRRGRYDRLRV